MSTDYELPALPFGGPETTISRWLKRAGDSLTRGEPLLVAVNDRVEAALPAPSDGVLEDLLVAEGAQTTAGAPIARIAAAADPVGATTAQPGSVPAGAMAAAAPRRASPVAQRIAGSAQLDIATLRGSGPGGRILKSDVLSALAAHSPQTPAPALVQTNGAGPGSGAPLTTLARPSTMRRAIAAHMVRSRATSPHALTAMEADMGRVAEARARLRESFARRRIDLTYTACIALAAAEALLRHPLLNSSWSEDGIILRRRVHLGIAVALPDGLITPVARDAQDLSLRGLARRIGDLARRARAGALQPGEASGGTFTITNPGAGAVWFGVPVINQPQGAILGVGAVRPRPLVVEQGGSDRIVVRPVALLTLAYDARICDQSHADAFLADVKLRLERFDQ